MCEARDRERVGFGQEKYLVERSRLKEGSAGKVSPVPQGLDIGWGFEESEGQLEIEGIGVFSRYARIWSGFGMEEDWSAISVCRPRARDGVRGW